MQLIRDRGGRACVHVPPAAPATGTRGTTAYKLPVSPTHIGHGCEIRDLRERHRRERPSPGGAFQLAVRRA
jgi:hypothetical protein